MNRSKMRLLVLALLGALCAGCGEGKPGKGASPSAASPTPTPDVVVVKVSRHPVSLYREFVAQTVASDTINVTARVTGTLSGFDFQEGRPVYAGQVLFQIDPSQYRAQVDQARAGVSQARANLKAAQDQVDLKQARASLAQAQANLAKAQRYVDIYKPLASQQVIPQQTFQDALSSRDVAAAQVAAAQAQVDNTRVSTEAQIEVARANVEAALAALEQAEINLSYCTITSPISGLIGTLNVYPGNVVGPSTGPLVTLSSADPVYVEFSIPEVAYLEIAGRMRQQPGRTAPFELVLADGTTYSHKGRFVLVERALNAQTGTLMVRTEFPNPKALLRPGEFARLRVQMMNVRDALLVPQEAVVQTQDLQIVLVVDAGGEVVSRTLEIGDEYGQDFIVTKGLKPGEHVIVEGLQKVRPGMTCKPVLQPSPTPRPGI